MITEQAIPCWKKMMKDGHENNIVFQTGHLWWKKQYSVKDMLNHYKNHDKIWDDYIFSATLTFMDSGL